MRRAVRVVVAVLLAYLIQSTALPYFKINGVVLDLITITLYTVGYTFGLYIGLMAGAFCALIMEVASGDLPALISVICVGAAWVGIWTSAKLRQFNLPGKRKLEQQIKRFAPMVSIALFVLLKETVYVGYFYLTGMDIALMHVGRVLTASLYTGVASVVLLPLIYNALMKKPGKKKLGGWLFKKRDGEAAKEKSGKKKERVASPVGEGFAMPTEGGTTDA